MGEKPVPLDKDCVCKSAISANDDALVVTAESISGVSLESKFCAICGS